MNTVTAHIDVSIPVGRRLLRDLNKHEKAATMDVSLPDASKTYTLDEAFEPLWKRLNEHYGVDLQKL